MLLVCLTWLRVNRTPVVDLKGKHQDRNSLLFQERPPVPGEGRREYSKYSLKLDMKTRDPGDGDLLWILPGWSAQLNSFSLAFSSWGYVFSCQEKLHDFSPSLFSGITQHWVCVCGLEFFYFVGGFWVCFFVFPLPLPRQPFSIQASLAFWDFMYQRTCINKLCIRSPDCTGHEDPWV